MRSKLPALVLAATIAAGSLASAAFAGNISDGVVRIGLLLDMSGAYADMTGPGSETAARMAAADFGGKV